MTTASTPGSDKTVARDLENRVVGRLYLLLDDRTEAVSAALQAAEHARSGRSPAERAERAAFQRTQFQRLAQLRAAEDRLCFGRVDLDDGACHYIGRVGLADPDRGTRALLDWRAPAAAAFYQATRADLMGIVRRRHLRIRNRTVTAVYDDLLDTDASPEVVSDARLDADASLFAALDAPRDGRLHDAVATIQAEQDRIIRGPLPGVLVVQGGPGTGKTVVALHRVAYLLYSHRNRVRGGVLVVGPGTRFMNYIRDVLPSLGESEVTLRALGELFDGVDARADDRLDVAALKGDLRMAKVVAATVEDLRRIPATPEPMDVDGQVIHLDPVDVAESMAVARRERLPHNEARVLFVVDLLDRIVRRMATALGYTPVELDEPTRADLLRILRGCDDVRRAVNRCWAAATPQQVIRRLLSSPGALERCAAGLTPDERARLRRRPDSPWTVSDVPLLDEAASLLGADPEPARRAAARAAADRAEQVRYAAEAARLLDPSGVAVDAAGMVDRYAQTAGAAPSGSLGPVIVGHVVVDEAQELTPMQWRAVLRRSPSRSLTVVGDMAQASRAGAAASWDEALRPHLGNRWTLRELTVNYRLPRAINQYAEQMLRSAGVAASPSRSVREGDDPLRLHPVTDLTAGLRLATAIRRQVRAAGDQRSCAIICPPELVEDMERALLRDSLGADALTSVLPPDQAKGLEFDVVLVLAPDAIAAAAGPRGLFVALTRATQRLHVIVPDSNCGGCRTTRGGVTTRPGEIAGPSRPGVAQDRRHDPHLRK